MLAIRPVIFLFGLLVCVAPVANATTCGDVKSFYKSQECCGSPDKAVSTAVPGCPYSFAKPACKNAEPQSPRDLTTDAPGEMKPKAATLNNEQAEQLPLVNVHYHLGAEHKSDAYNDDTDSLAYDNEHGRRLATDPRPGFMCSTEDLGTTQMEAYDFAHCLGKVEVGKSYEIHYVHSSAGYRQEELVDADIDGIDDGLGGAANGRGLLNPMVVVQGQVFQIVNGGANVTDMLHGWTVLGHDNAVMYPGSTTGPSHNNEVCSPYAITWHVDLNCHRVSPESFDRLCEQMKARYGLEDDLSPHGSRKILDSKWVVEADYVKQLA